MNGLGFAIQTVFLASTLVRPMAADQLWPLTDKHSELAGLEPHPNSLSVAIADQFGHSRIGNTTIRQTAPLKRGALKRSDPTTHLIRIISDNAMVETICSSAVAITSFVSPSAPTPLRQRGLRVMAIPRGIKCWLSASTIALKPQSRSKTDDASANAAIVATSSVV